MIPEENLHQAPEPGLGQRLSPLVERALVLAGILVLVASRLPFVLQSWELNVDESGMMATAIRMKEDWLPWRSTCAGTSGPLNPGLLYLAGFLGVPLSYAAVHSIALGLLSLTLLAVWRVARRVAGSTPALVAFLSCSLLAATSLGTDFTHYASELVPNACMAVGLVFLVRHGGLCTRHPALLVPGLILLGAAPWAKIQAAPIALVLCFWVALCLWFSPEARGESLARRSGLLVLATLSALLPSLTILHFCYWGGSMELFWRTYILFNLSYVGLVPEGLLASLFLRLISSPWLLGFWGVLILVLVLRPRAGLRQRWLQYLLCLLPFAVAFATIARTPRSFAHYQLLLLPGLLLSTALLMQLLLSVRTAEQRLRSRSLPFLGAVALLLLPIVVSLVSAVPTWLQSWTKGPALNSRQHYLSGVLSKRILPGGTLAVYGWAPFLYVDLKAKPATRFSDFCYLVAYSSERDYLRGLFMQDLKKSLPDHILVLDDGFGIPKGMGAPFPELLDLFAEHYDGWALGPDLLLFKRKKNSASPHAHTTQSVPPVATMAGGPWLARGPMLDSVSP